MRKGKKASTIAQTVRRENPEMFTVDLDGMPVVLQRPILNRDKLIVKLETESLENAVKFIASKGITHESLLRKRQYRTSGQVGVWSFHQARYLYRKTTAGLERTNSVDNAVLCDEVHDRESGDREQDFEVIGDEGLQAAISEGESEADQDGADEAEPEAECEATQNASL